MEQNPDIRQFKDRYSSILEAYTTSQQEEYLDQAAQLGRQLVLARVPPEDIAEIHEEAVKRLAEQSTELSLLTFANHISAPLVEMLMAYGLAFREWLDELKQAQEKLLQYQSQLRTLALKLVQTEQQQRRLIASAVHDDITQKLVMAKMVLSLAEKKATNPDMLKGMDRACEMIDEAIDQTRTIISRLANPALLELGLTAAVEQYLDEEIRRKHGITFELKSDRRADELDQDISGYLFRGARELLVNVVKHANARKVKVSIRCLDDHVRLSVEDDGVGFNPTKLSPAHSSRDCFGLFGVRELFKSIGGYMEIDSEPGRGSKVTVVAPLQQKAAT